MLKPTLLSAALLQLPVSFECAEHVPPITESSENAGFDPKPGTVRIPRERNLSLRDYYENYADLQRPVIVEDYSAAFANFTVENIVSVCGEARRGVTVARKGKASVDQWAGIQMAWAGTDLSAVVRDPSLGDDNDDPDAQTYGLFDWSLPRYCPWLLRDYFTVPKYVAQDFLQRVPPSRPLKYRDDWPSLFVGAPGTYGGLHQDVFGSAFWQYVVEGTKEWQIVDPVVESMDFFGGGATRGTSHYHDVLKPGDLLIIPGDAWHQVRNGRDGKTVAICGNFISRGNMGTMRRVVEAEADLKSSYYKELEDTLLQEGFDTSVDLERGDMTWIEFKSQSPEGGREYEPFDVNETPSIAVEVSGAGSLEANGVYRPNGDYGGANQFEMQLEVDDDEGNGGTAVRFFELFKVEGSGWWNIIERTSDEEYPYPVHYGAEVAVPADRLSRVLPPSRGWASKAFGPDWRGVEPFPTIKIIGLDDEGKIYDKGESLDVVAEEDRS